jgi:hypothetical protein
MAQVIQDKGRVDCQPTQVHERTPFMAEENWEKKQKESRLSSYD